MQGYNALNDESERQISETQTFPLFFIKGKGLFSYNQEIIKDNE
jgi:hypothetical protein